MEFYSLATGTLEIICDFFLFQKMHLFLAIK
jgi:hypothetical protein